MSNVTFCSGFRVTNSVILTFFEIKAFIQSDARSVLARATLFSIISADRVSHTLYQSAKSSAEQYSNETDSCINRGAMSTVVKIVLRPALAPYAAAASRDNINRLILRSVLGPNWSMITQVNRYAADSSAEITQCSPCQFACLNHTTERSWEQRTN